MAASFFLRSDYATQIAICKPGEIFFNTYDQIKSPRVMSFERHDDHTWYYASLSDNFKYCLFHHYQRIVIMIGPSEVIAKVFS